MTTLRNGHPSALMPEVTGFYYDPDQPLPAFDINSPVMTSAGVVGFSALKSKPVLLGLGAAFILWRVL
jgi:hypothetical protein